MAEENQEELKPTSETAAVVEGTKAGETLAHEVAPDVDSQAGDASGREAGKRGNRAQKVGIVASDKMQKTVVVRVDRLVKHPKYRRYVRRTSKFMAHDEENTAKVGDRVAIVESRPLSKRKRWVLTRVVRKAPVV